MFPAEHKKPHIWLGYAQGHPDAGMISADIDLILVQPIPREAFVLDETNWKHHGLLYPSIKVLKTLYEVLEWYPNEESVVRVAA